MTDYKEIIHKYFSSWIENKPEVIDTYFADTVLYSESYGPEYRNKVQVKKWFEDWQTKGKVFRWDISEIYTDSSVYTVEWYFECEYLKTISRFNGVSLIEFDKHGKIVTVKEFQSKAEHTYPYKDIQ
ncbi:MAG: nuclear transport factor 2 family protein [Treponema sp.]|nr:nuclear transport factor 2 family protein [Treponema sp.]